ncbi:MAG: four helix bundle protein [Chitinophagaceae bacterium]|nr:four helix bundle protein [Chitinophagaceae bacterium]
MDYVEKENVVKSKSFAFSVRIVRLYQYLANQKKEFIIAKQLLRSGTSVGAMVKEAEHAESRNDFKHKISIAQKEINESIYWLELLRETEYLSKEEFVSLKADAIELLKIVTAIIKSVKVNKLN